jgi:ureidoglycolate hydrolase
MEERMDESLLEVREYTGEGYKPLIDFCAWRVAILRWIDELLPERIRSMERHTQTDEVFVLLEGQATLIVGGGGLTMGDIHAQVMEGGKLYNVKQNTWHTVLLSRDASILIVENQDTGEVNSEYCFLTEKQRQEIMGIEDYS